MKKITPSGAAAVLKKRESEEGERSSEWRWLLDAQWVLARYSQEIAGLGSNELFPAVTGRKLLFSQIYDGKRNCK